MKFLLIIASLMIASPALAVDNVALTNKVFVERQVSGPDGKPKLVREAPKLVVPGEKLLFVLDYKNEGVAPAEKFVVTNPIPASVAFVASDAPGADYSVDGGKVWGSLASLKATAPDGSPRTAAASDVTHIRWIFVKAIPVGGSGTLSFRGVVR